MSKFVGLVFILLGITVMGGVVYYYLDSSPPSLNTENPTVWGELETYAQDELEMQFKYPKSWADPGINVNLPRWFSFQQKQDSMTISVGVQLATSPNDGQDTSWKQKITPANKAVKGIFEGIKDISDSSASYFISYGLRNEYGDSLVVAFNIDKKDQPISDQDKELYQNSAKAIFDSVTFSDDFMRSLPARYRDLQRLEAVDTLYKSLSILEASNGDIPYCAIECVYTSLSGTQSITGNGWIPVNFSEVPDDEFTAKYVVSLLPLDPINSSNHYLTTKFYRGTYTIQTRLEHPLMRKHQEVDGGNFNDLYEKGNYMSTTSMP